ncbi:MAG: hypothetical protein IPH07_22015 [Deltaproteobacteria bacterium]|nr:hypothetical protein [Deltaproteobacteria bacterium]MBK8714353.1 hypothetical protein [Deltaproteobacteria bacterium]
MKALHRVALACCSFLSACTDEMLCPDGWYEHEYECVATSKWLSRRPTESVYGFVKLIEGGCGPGDHTCRVELLDGHVVEVIELLAPDTDHECWATAYDDEAGADDPEGEDPEVTLVADARTDGQGRFAIAVPPGRYCLRTVDPGDGAWWSVPFDILAGARTPVTIEFDYGAY